MKDTIDSEGQMHLDTSDATGCYMADCSLALCNLHCAAFLLLHSEACKALYIIARVSNTLLGEGHAYCVTCFLFMSQIFDNGTQNSADPSHNETADKQTAQAEPIGISGGSITFVKIASYTILQHKCEWHDVIVASSLNRLADNRHCEGCSLLIP